MNRLLTVIFCFATLTQAIAEETEVVDYTISTNYTVTLKADGVSCIFYTKGDLVWSSPSATTASYKDV